MQNCNCVNKSYFKVVHSRIKIDPILTLFEKNHITTTYMLFTVVLNVNSVRNKFEALIHLVLENVDCSYDILWET